MMIQKITNNSLFELDFVKDYLKAIDLDDDDVINACIEAAESEAEGIIMSKLIVNKYRYLDSFNGPSIELKDLNPAWKVTKVSSYEMDDSGSLTSVDVLSLTTDYTFSISKKGIASVCLTPSGEEYFENGSFISIEVIAGRFATKEDVPARISKGILKIIADNYDVRGDQDGINIKSIRSSDRKLWLDREWVF